MNSCISCNYLLKIEGKYILESRYIYERAHKIKILNNQHIHHIDHNPSNNKIENLQLLSDSEHIKLHKGCNDIDWGIIKEWKDKGLPTIRIAKVLNCTPQAVNYNLRKLQTG